MSWSIYLQIYCPSLGYCSVTKNWANIRWYWISEISDDYYWSTANDVSSSYSIAKWTIQ